MSEAGDSSRKARQGDVRLTRSRRQEAPRKDSPAQNSKLEPEARRTPEREGRSRSELSPPKRDAKRSPKLNHGANSGQRLAKGTTNAAQTAHSHTLDQSRLGQNGAGSGTKTGETPRRWLGWFGPKASKSGDRATRSAPAPAPKAPNPKKSATSATAPTQLEGPSSLRSPSRQSAKQRRLNRQQALAGGSQAGSQAAVPNPSLNGGRSPNAPSRSNTKTAKPNLNGPRFEGRDRPDSRLFASSAPPTPAKRRDERPEGNPTPSPRFGRRSSFRGVAEHRAAASEATVVPLPLNGKRSPRSRQRSADTQLQTNAPTRLQGNTQLQHATQIQADSPRSRRQRPPRLVPPPPPAEPLFQPRTRSMAIALYAARMLILSIGVGVLAGTVLSAWNPANQAFWQEHLGKQAVKQANSAGEDAKPQPPQPKTDLQLAQELTALKTGIQGITQQFTGITPGVFLVDLDTNNYVDWSGSASLAAASTIKVPVLIAFFQDVDAGKISLDEPLTMTKDTVAQGSGDMQYLPVGAKFSALETANKMITISDNTATNMLIKRLGGLQALNQRFQSWGLSITKFNDILPDLKGTNTTSAKELTSLMVRVSQGELVSLRSRDRLLDIMRRTVNNSQIPQGLGEGATVAHKTGDIGTLIGDVGLVDMPSGKRYAIAILAKREFNDDRAYDLIQKVSRLVYQTLNTPAKPAANSEKTTPTPQSPLPATEPDESDTQGQTAPTQPTAPTNPMQTAAQ